MIHFTELGPAESHDPLFYRSSLPIAITLAHPENHKGSPFFLRAQRIRIGGQDVFLTKCPAEDNLKLPHILHMYSNAAVH